MSRVPRWKRSRLNWYRPRTETDRAQLLSWLRSAQADVAGPPAEESEMATLLWAGDAVNEWAQWNAGDPVPTGYTVWSSLESGVMYVGLPEAAHEWNRNMAPMSEPVDVDSTIDALCDRIRLLEAALKDLVDERLQGDDRPPQPALQRAIAVLRPSRT